MSGSASSRAPERRPDGLTERELARRVTGLVGNAREARWIVEEAAGDEARAFQLANRRAEGEPLQHVLGHWGFRRLDVRCDRRALVPRPETEVVVEIALAELRRVAARGGRPLLVADLGTGSGVIACAIADELDPETEVSILATDDSNAALALARENCERTGTAGRIELLRESWFEALPETVKGRLDLIVSNPPYLADHELGDLDPVVKDHDPRKALVAGRTGLECLAHLIAGSPAWLSGDGSLVLEIAPHQDSSVEGLAEAAGFVAAHVEPDLAGRPRVLVARR
jgi:release factor glutamine methyltransferase